METRSGGNESFRGEPLEIQRTLTEVAHLLAARRLDGTYDPAVIDGVRANLATKVQEDAMSAAVSTTFQPAEYVKNETGEMRRRFLWKGLGRTAVQVAESGYDFHSSQAAFMRVGVEVAEAIRSEDDLAPGKAQVFISPKMTEADAPIEVAMAEHLALDDAIRTSTAVVDERGNVVGRRMQALLVRDIPLEAWVAMLKDEANVFGRSFDIDDDTSSLSVMKLFNQLDLPEDALPEGPVTLVADVVRYIQDHSARKKVHEQLGAFRTDQAKLQHEADYTAQKWVHFEVELAESLHTEVMQPSIETFVVQLQNSWQEDMLNMLREHETNEGHGLYAMTPKLAAAIELAWQKVHIAEAAVVVNDKRSLANLNQQQTKELKDIIAFTRTIERSGEMPLNYQHVQARMVRALANSNVESGAGCSGQNKFRFKGGGDALPDGLQEPNGLGGESGPSTDVLEDAESKTGEETIDVCRIKNCPTRPGKTKVGGCTICLDECQPLFDDGMSSTEIEKYYEQIYGDEAARNDEAVDTGTWLSGTTEVTQKRGQLVLAAVE